MASMLLQNQPVLVIDPSFALQLFNVLEAEGAEILVAKDGTQALEFLERFDFAVVLVGDRPPLTTNLIDAFGNVPVIFYGRTNKIDPIKPWQAVPKKVSAIVHALKHLVEARTH
jgi:hypothetical protein